METTEDPKSPKKTIERSASYPGINLEETIDFVTNVTKNFGLSQMVNRQDISALLKTSSVNRQVAAAVQFGLFNRIKDGYQVSQLFKSIKSPLSEVEKKKCLLEAFGAPKLFKEIIEKFDAHVVPTELKTHLERFHDIAEKAAPQAAEIFLESARFCAALNGNNILNYADSLKKYSNPNLQFAEVLQQEDQSRVSESRTDNNYQHNNIRLLPESVENVASYKELPIPLSDKKTAYLKYPVNLTEKDILILKKQIELLELTL